MRKKKVVLDYSGLKDDEFSTLAGKVVDCLDGHPLFTDLPVAVADLKAEVELYKSRWQKASRGGSLVEIAEKNDTKRDVSEMLRKIAFYVNEVGNGVRSALLSSGLILEADPSSMPTPAKTTNASLTDGLQQDQFKVGFDRVPNALLYEYQISDKDDEQGNPIWSDSYRTGSTRGNVFAPVVKDVTYRLRVRAVNKKGAGDWSDVVSLRAR
ncbi:fibronectin type III domain-containing protein [Sphingobacterium faecale]|uniref:Fibronectin type III domain-containing protein n=1 Tax=Sphingobacterium faecale TaxID=2803775 RepID=A0ABS1R7V7_9SPHI|nr:fibronectin type III domain-containing protein [Sphingobacterium faecale]MBL1410810.1 fibronectin type III domain-containing protein [Sphingobacterium faecale]